MGRVKREKRRTLTAAELRALGADPERVRLVIRPPADKKNFRPKADATYGEGGQRRKGER